MNVARRASSKTLRPIRLRIAETLAVALLALVFQAPGVGAFEALDGRLQVHGFYAMQLRGMSADWKDQFDMTQWYNVLNLEIELDLAPDGFEPFLDLASSYVRAEVRFDCIYYNGCEVVRPMHTYGNDSRNLPGRLSGARQRLATMGLGLESPSSDVFPAPADQPDGGETVAYVDTTLTGSRVLPSRNPAPITEISPFNVLANQAGIDRYRGDPPRLPEYDNLDPVPTPFGPIAVPQDMGSKILLPDDPYPFVFPEYISDIHAGAVNGKGGGGFGLPVTTLAPWRPKDYAAPTALLFDKINPFDNTRTPPQISASYYNASMFDQLSDLRIEVCVSGGGTPASCEQTASYARGDMDVDDPSTWYNNVMADTLSNFAFGSIRLMNMEAAAQVAGFGDLSTSTPAPTGFGANPLAPIPVVAEGAGLEATGYAPQGLFMPSKYFRAALAAGDLSDEGATGSLGRAVAVSGNRAALGAADAVYLLTRSAENPNFAHIATISAPDGSSGFGRSLALRGTDLVVGAPNTTVGDLSDAGRAYLYDFLSPDDPVHVFEAAEPVMRERIGWAVGLGNDFVAVSAPGGDGAFEIGMTDGRILVFDLDSGNLQIELALEVPDDSDYFGASIAVYAASVAVGAPYEDGETGAVYLFTVPEPGALLVSLTGLATLALRARSRSRPS